MEEKVRELLGPLAVQGGSDIPEGESDEEFGGPINRRSKQRTQYEAGMRPPKRNTLWQTICAKVSELLEETAICPLENIRFQSSFLKYPYLTDPYNSSRVREAIQIWSYKINKFTLKDYFEFYGLSEDGNFNENQYKKYVFVDGQEYYDMEESLYYMDTLLKFQFDDDVYQIKDFLQQLVNIVNRQPVTNPNRNSKLNTLVVVSPKSAGKNFFFDTLLNLCLNYGQLGTSNGNNNFAFQDALSRRIILWNEPNYESAMTDYLKTLFEGGKTKVRVKNKEDTDVSRTPLIILTNHPVPFMNDKDFEDRIIKYKWKAAIFLKDTTKKPHPLSFFKLLLKYAIKF